LTEQLNALDSTLRAENSELHQKLVQDQHRMNELENECTDLKHQLEIEVASHSGQKSEL
jgi:predicted RNase H-like nuclease (RuvC/YqgF family)